MSASGEGVDRRRAALGTAHDHMVDLDQLALSSATRSSTSCNACRVVASAATTNGARRAWWYAPSSSSLFTAAYLAEIVRGGLQSVAPAHEEAAKALGPSPTRTTLLIVLPQALRNVIPAQIGQFISLFKDVSLAGAAMGVFDLLDVAQTITKQPGFSGQRLDVETLAFVALLFWVGSYTMSRESQRLEKKLGVGTR